MQRRHRCRDKACVWGQKDGARDIEGQMKVQKKVCNCYKQDKDMGEKLNLVQGSLKWF